MIKKIHPIGVLVWLSGILTVGTLICIISYIFIRGLPPLIYEISLLLSGMPSIFSFQYNSNNLSLISAILNTIILTLTSVTITSFLGICTAIYLVEYSNKGNIMVRLIGIATETLSSIPSIVYGLFGSIFFVVFLGLGISMLAGTLTISIMILPLIIRCTEESLYSVSNSFREASYGLGAGKFRTIFMVVLPSASNGILAGIILAVGRVMGETAALLYTSGTSHNFAVDFLSSGRTLSIHMYMLASEGLHIDKTFATATILLLIILSINTFSTFIAKQVLKGH